MTNNTNPSEKYALGYTIPGATGLNKQNIANNTISNLNLQNSINTQGALAAQAQMPQQMPQQQMPVRQTKPNTQSNNFIPQESAPSQAQIQPQVQTQIQPHTVGTDAQGRPTLDGQPWIPEETPEQVESGSSIKVHDGDVRTVPFKNREIPQGQEIVGSADKNAYKDFSDQFNDIDNYLNSNPSSEEDKELFSQFSDYTLRNLKDDIGQKSFNNNRTIPRGFNLKNHLKGILNFAKISGKDPDAVASDFNGLLFVAGNNDKNTAADQINYFELTGTSLGAASEEFKNYSAQVMKKADEGIISEQDALDLIDAKKQQLSEKEGFADAFLSKGESNREVRYSILGDAIFGLGGKLAKPLMKPLMKPLGKAMKVPVGKLVDAAKKLSGKAPDFIKEHGAEIIHKLHLDSPVAKAGEKRVLKQAESDMLDYGLKAGVVNPVDMEAYSFYDRVHNRAEYDQLIDYVMKKKGVNKDEATSILHRAIDAHPDSKWAKVVRRGEFSSDIPSETASLLATGADESFDYAADILAQMSKENLDELLDAKEFGSTLAKRIEKKALADGYNITDASRFAEEGKLISDYYSDYISKLYENKEFDKLSFEMLNGATKLDAANPEDTKTLVDLLFADFKKHGFNGTQKAEAIGRQARYRKQKKENMSNENMPKDDISNGKTYGPENKPLGPVKVNPDDAIDRGVKTALGGELGKELDNILNAPGVSSSVKKPEEVTESSIGLNSLANGDSSYIPYRGPKLEEPLTWEGQEKYREVYDKLKSDIQAAEKKGQITPEEADALQERATMYNTFINSIKNSPLNDVPDLIEAVEKAQGKVNDYSTTRMPKTWLGAYLSGEFGDPKSKDAKRTLAYFTLNSLGTALMNSSAVIQKRPTTDTQWNIEQGERLRQADARYDKAKTRAFENNLDSIAKAMNMSLEQKNKVVDLMNEGKIKLLYDKLGDTRKLELLEKVARFAPYYNKLSDSQKAAMAAIMIDSGLTPRDELSILSTNFSKRQIAELLGGMKNAEYLNKMYNSHVTQKQVELVSAQIQQAIQSAKLTEAEANLYSIKVYAELADKGIDAAMRLLNSLLPGGSK